MSSSSSKTTPLPSHASYTALRNQISLLQSRRSSVLSSLTARTSSPPSAARDGQGTAVAVASRSGHATSSRTHGDKAGNGDEEEEEDLFRGNNRPNEGLGYVATPKASTLRESKKEVEALKRQLLGRRGGHLHQGSSSSRGGAGLPKLGQARWRRAEESEDDDDEGRSAVGKGKKRKRKDETFMEARGQDGLADDEDDQPGKRVDGEPPATHVVDRETETRQEGGEPVERSDRQQAKTERKRKPKKKKKP